MNISYPKTFKRGFSLLELLAVIAIIAILVGIIVATYMMAMGKRDEKKIEAEMEAIKLAIEYYHTEHNIYPENGPTPEENLLYVTLTQGGKDGKKNFLKNFTGKNDGKGNLIAPVEPVPLEPGKDRKKLSDGTVIVLNNWKYLSGKNAKQNPGRYDLWVEYLKGDKLMIKGNW